MAKVKISEYSTTNSSNTDINSINIDEGCAPSGINNAIREVMVHLKNWQTNASGDGATFASLVVQGTGSFTGAVTMSAGSTLSGTNTLSGANIISGNINSSGTTNTFSGGNILSGTNTLSGATVMAASLGTSANPSIYFTSDTNTGIFSPTADTVGVATGGSERLRVNSSGNVGIGTTAPKNSDSYDSNRTFLTVQAKTGGVDRGAFLELVGTAGGSPGYWLGAINFYSTGNTYKAAQIASVTDSGGANSGSLLFFTGTAANTTDATERMRIDSSGNVLVGTTSATSNGGVLQVSNGITFPATQSACSNANTLDDYEEGTWTPTASTNITVSGGDGIYTKIGRAVYCQASITVTALSGDFTISGLPFTSSANRFYSAGIPYFPGVTITSQDGIQVNSSATTITFYRTGTYSGAGITSYFSFWYFV